MPDDERRRRRIDRIEKILRRGIAERLGEPAPATVATATPEPRKTFLGTFELHDGETLAVISGSVEDAAAQIEEAAFRNHLAHEAEVKRIAELFWMPDLTKGKK